MSFLANILREEGGFEFKRAIMETVLSLINEIPDAVEQGPPPLVPPLPYALRSVRPPRRSSTYPEAALRQRSIRRSLGRAQWGWGVWCGQGAMRGRRSADGRGPAGGAPMGAVRRDGRDAAGRRGVGPD